MNKIYGRNAGRSNARGAAAGLSTPRLRLSIEGERIVGNFSFIRWVNARLFIKLFCSFCQSAFNFGFQENTKSKQLVLLSDACGITF